jgi:hypothetical protein
MPVAVVLGKRPQVQMVTSAVKRGALIISIMVMITLASLSGRCLMLNMSGGIIRRLRRLLLTTPRRRVWKPHCNDDKWTSTYPSRTTGLHTSVILPGADRVAELYSSDIQLHVGLGAV